MFPHVAEPLHIFESRYREMFEDALAGDQRLGMALLQPGWEPEYHGRPPIEPMLCVGKVVTHSRLPDGRYNFVLMGESRARLLEELPALRSFREARIELVADREVLATPENADLQRRLAEGFSQFLPENTRKSEQFRELLSPTAPLGPLTDIVAYALPLEASQKQQLLSEENPILRATLLEERIDELLSAEEAPKRRWPPDFSDN